MTIRVLLADDQKLILGGLRMVVESSGDMAVAGEATSGAEAVAMARETLADVVLMDLRMPGMDGIEATRRITADDDLAGVKVLVLTTFEMDENVLRALRAGASGFLGKGVEPDDLLDGIRTVARGEALLSPKATQTLIARFLDQPEPVPARLAAPLEQLTAREREILALVAEGLSNDEIARRLYVSPLTAKTHISRTMTKLGARDRAQLVMMAFQTGLVSPGGTPG